MLKCSDSRSNYSNWDIQLPGYAEGVATSCATNAVSSCTRDDFRLPPECSSLPDAREGDPHDGHTSVPVRQQSSREGAG
jgi:hypothetical protein